MVDVYILTKCGFILLQNVNRIQNHGNILQCWGSITPSEQQHEKKHPKTGTGLFIQQLTVPGRSTAHPSPCYIVASFKLYMYIFQEASTMVGFHISFSEVFNVIFPQTLFATRSSYFAYHLTLPDLSFLFPQFSPSDIYPLKSLPTLWPFSSFMPSLVAPF